MIDYCFGFVIYIVRICDRLLLYFVIYILTSVVDYCFGSVVYFVNICDK